MAFQQSITVRQIPMALHISAAKKVPAYFQGSAGLGKSMIIQDVATVLLDNAIAALKVKSGITEATRADDLEYLEGIRGINFIDVRLALETPEALNGLLIPTKGDDGVFQTQRSYDTRFVKDPRFVGILLLDELPAAPPFMQNIAYKLLLDRCIGEMKMPEGMCIAAAGNGVEHGGASYELLKPVQNRITAYDVAPSAEVWLEDFAYRTGVNKSMTSLIKEQPSLIYNGDIEHACPAFSSARSLTSAAKTIDMMEAGMISLEFAKISIAGDIGEVAASKWALHHELGSKLPSIRDILDGKDPVLNKEMDHAQAHYYVAYACLSMVMTDYHTPSVNEEDLLDSVNNVFLYMLDHMPTSHDIQVSLATEVRALTRDGGKRDSFSHRIVNDEKTPNFRSVLKEYVQVTREIKAFEAKAK